MHQPGDEPPKETSTIFLLLTFTEPHDLGDKHALQQKIVASQLQSLVTRRQATPFLLHALNEMHLRCEWPIDGTPAEVHATVATAVEEFYEQHIASRLDAAMVPPSLRWPVDVSRAVPWPAECDSTTMVRTDYVHVARLHLGFDRSRARELHAEDPACAEFRLLEEWVEAAQRASRCMKEGVSHRFLTQRAAGEVEVVGLLAALRTTYTTVPGSGEHEVLTTVMQMLSTDPHPFDPLLPRAANGPYQERAYAIAANALAPQETPKVQKLKDSLQNQLLTLAESPIRRFEEDLSIYMYMLKILQEMQYGAFRDTVASMLPHGDVKSLKAMALAVTHRVKQRLPECAESYHAPEAQQRLNAVIESEADDLRTLLLTGVTVGCRQHVDAFAVAVSQVLQLLIGIPYESDTITMAKRAVRRLGRVERPESLLSDAVWIKHVARLHRNWRLLLGRNFEHGYHDIKDALANMAAQLREPLSKRTMLQVANHWIQWAYDTLRGAGGTQPLAIPLASMTHSTPPVGSNVFAEIPTLHLKLQQRERRSAADMGSNGVTFVDKVEDLIVVTEVAQVLLRHLGPRAGTSVADVVYNLMTATATRVKGIESEPKSFLPELPTQAASILNVSEAEDGARWSCRNDDMYSHQPLPGINQSSIQPSAASALSRVNAIEETAQSRQAAKREELRARADELSRRADEGFPPSNEDLQETAQLIGDYRRLWLAEGPILRS